MNGEAAAVPLAPVAPRPRRALGDRLNPILVKEVRQSLRGKYFRVMFWLTLLVSTGAGLLVVATGAADGGLEFIGQPYFMVMFGCMAAATHGFTPFWAFLTTSAEWDENTHDLLVLSNLRPRQIVSGKLLSALVQGLLYYSTFGPFLVFAFLLNGIDLFAIGVLLACSLATCVSLSLIGIAFASLARTRAARGLLMALFGAGLVGAWGASMGMAGSIVFQPEVLRDPGAWLGVTFFVFVVLLVGAIFGLVAAARFSHEEENRSSAMRVVSLAIVLCASAWAAWGHRESGDSEVTWAAQVGAAVLLYAMWVFFLTEPDSLGRRTAKHVPAKPALALLAAPFLPGGGLAVLLFFLHLAFALLGTSFALSFGLVVTNVDAVSAIAEVLALYGYAFVYVALPAAIVARRVRTPRGRSLARVAILLLLPIGILLPALLGLLVGNERWMEMEHFLNPAWLMSRLDNSGSAREAPALAGTLLVLALVTLALNARRAAAGLREVRAASLARAAREASRPAPET